ncbi:hypothetical protein MMC14_002607 [Varicellaria rhodocarpa]|nr:hypothetical protein [Varicellaria rhodocarpa]
MVRFIVPATAAFFLAFYSLVQADSSIPSCGANQQCPDSLPCCSQYGQCGVGAYCLGGCDPRFSHSLDSCVPAPVCRSEDYKLTSLDGITPNTKYLGDASTSNWVSSGQPIAYQDQVLLTMAQGTVGTLLASTSYVWYGKISATLKTSRGQGVVTAFILLSDVKDEIDWEFIGADLNDGQSNYYFQGLPDYDNEQNISVTDTFGTYHTYEIDWTPDTVTWSVDGTAHRTKNRNETWNATSNQYHFPQSPARIQLSLWPAGLSSNGEGTVAWSGGLVDWNSPDVQNAGYYYAMVNDVNVECYNPPSGASVSGSKSYIYNGPAGTNNTVVTTNDNTVLKSLLGTGTNMSANYPSAASGTNSASGAAATSDAPTIPGLSGAGPGTNGQRGSGGSSGSSGSQSSGVSSASGSSQTGFHGFSQGGNSGTSTASPQNGEKVLHGSMLAVLIAIVGMLVL